MCLRLLLGAVSLGAGAATGVSSLRRQVSALQADSLNLSSRPEYHWQPTDFTPRGCVEMKVVPEEVHQDAFRMTVSRCFAFCSMKRGMGFFGITKGKECWCASSYEGTKADKERCSLKCPGDSELGCGGAASVSSLYSNVYLMFDCAENTEEEKNIIQQEKYDETMHSYSILPDQTCGGADSNKIEVDGGVTFVGSPEECKIMCMHGSGNVECHGFSYNKVLQRCTFHPDVMDGPVEKTSDTDCWFKVLGLLQGMTGRPTNATVQRCRSFQHVH